jgi:endonuclease/exonuclease/phosphatase (EEP) superfamily protein YafD
VSWLYLLCIGLCWLLLWAGSDQHWLATLFVFGPRWAVALPLVVLIPWALLVRSWRALGALIVAALVVAGPITGGTVSPQTWWQDETAGRIRVLTCNVDGPALNARAMAALIAESKPDIVFFQEAGSPQCDGLFPEGWNVCIGPGGLRLASRFQIVGNDTLRAKELGLPGSVRRYTLETSAGELTVVNFHLPTPRDGFEMIVHGSSKGIGVIRDQIAMRDRASAVTKQWLGEMGSAVIAAGDFNMPMESAIYRRHWSDLGNSFSEAGWGWGFTKQTRWFGVRIDHVLHGSAWQCRKAWVGPDVGSDHRPMIVDLLPRN